MKETFSARIRKLIRQTAKAFVLHRYYPMIYRRAARGEADPSLAVFLGVRGDILTDNLVLLREGCEARGMKTAVLTIGEGRLAARKVIKNCVKAIPTIAKASCIFLDEPSYFLSALPLRPETKVVQTWHGCGAFKRFGYSAADTPFGVPLEDFRRFPLYRHYSLVPVSSPEVVWAYEEAFHMEDFPGRVQALGVSRTDVFFDREFIRRARERVLHEAPEARGKKLLLYAPTFRGKAGQAKAPAAMDYRLLSESLSESFFLLVKQHPMVRKREPLPENCSAFMKDVTETLSIEDLLCAADMCISDYSSLIFEYSLFERPMIFFAFDLEEYFDERGFYYPYEDFAPGPVCRTTEEILGFIEHAEERFDREKVRAFREKFMSACDGKATDRILSSVFRR